MGFRECSNPDGLVFPEGMTNLCHTPVDMLSSNDETNPSEDEPMIRVSAFPTVEWLRSRAADRPAISPSGRRLTDASNRAHRVESRPDDSVGSRSAGRPGRGSRCVRSTGRRRRAGGSVRRVFLESLAVRLAEALAPGVGVYMDHWVSTPDGELPLDLVIRRGQRRLGLIVGQRYEQDTETVDALRLVYGGFDVLYRLNGVGAPRSVDDALYALICERPSWFTTAGRVGAGRRVSAAALLVGSGERAASETGPADPAGRITIRRMRLSRANDWVAAFERALGSPEGHPAGHQAGHPAGHPEQD